MNRSCIGERDGRGKKVNLDGRTEDESVREVRSKWVGFVKPLGSNRPKRGSYIYIQF